MNGRGYTLADPSCNTLLCPFTDPSNRAPYTSYPGVMSLSEIKQTIKDRRLTPKLLTESLMKQITWDDQWIGYDDEETFALKRSFADSMCFGGTMIWSIDFQGEGSGGYVSFTKSVCVFPKLTLVIVLTSTARLSIWHLMLILELQLNATLLAASSCHQGSGTSLGKSLVDISCSGYRLTRYVPIQLRRS
jgi:hypothetical protein